VQCNSCSIGCSHAVIRPRLLKPGTDIRSIPSRRFPGFQFTLDVSPYDCLGCGVCIDRCPTKALTLTPSNPTLLADLDRHHVAVDTAPDPEELGDHDPAVRATLEGRKFTVDGSQYFRPLLEYSGACAGCHETLYAKLASQLFGARMIAANGIGCSSVWAGTFPSMSFRATRDGRGISSGVSLFEDCAEFGMGIYTAYTHRRGELRSLIEEALGRPDLPEVFRREFSGWLASFNKGDETLVISDRVNALLANTTTPGWFDPIRERSDLFCKPTFWIVGGDGWANDIGFAGVDHVIASGADVNFLVYDNEGYANTGFQMSKSTPRGAVMKFAATGRDKPKKGLAQMMLQYKDAFVANCAIAADPAQTVKAFQQAEAHVGPSLVVCYCSCVGHGIKGGMGAAHKQVKLAVESGYVPLWRRHPTEGFVLDSKGCDEKALKEMVMGEVRYEVLERIDKERFNGLYNLLRQDIAQRWQTLQGFAKK
jgi:pyruvate-ferredoxin/flavodoxin oxidoreductase